MKNNFLNFFRNTITINVKGKNIERFLKRLVREKIELYKIDVIHYNEINIKISYKDLERVLEIKTIYDVEIVNYYGLLKFKRLINKNKLLILSIVLGICLLYFLSNIIFNIEIIHNDKELRDMLESELKKYDVTTFKLKKNYNELESIKGKILDDHKEELEWIEIEVVGTKYIVRVEERKMNVKEESVPVRNIVATKHAVLKSIDAKSGDIVREINTYVKPGDVVISGDIKLNEESKAKVGADGVIYGEVWYQTQVEFPYEYHEKNYTGKKKTVYSFKFLNNYFDLFNFKPYKQYETKEKVILGSSLLPISLVKVEQREVIKKDKTYTELEALNEALKLAKNKIEKNLDEKEYIISQKKLKVEARNSKIVVDVFFKVYENITGYSDIPEEIKEE